jgi:hypothetical protein
VYRLIVELVRPGMGAGGFQLAARHEDGRQAGVLTGGGGEGERVAVVESRSVLYAQHALAGSEPTGHGSIRWELLWTAPPGPEPVIFTVAANAADGDDTISGDWIYTASTKASAR